MILRISTLLILCSVNFVFAGDNFERVQKKFNKFNSKFNTPIMPTNKINLEKMILVDVRSEKEQKVSMIPGAISVAEFEKNKEKYRGKAIITYCTIGYRSGKYAKQLLKEKFNAYNLEGSILGWSHSKGSLVDLKGKPTKKVHIYSKGWDYLPKGFTPVH